MNQSVDGEAYRMKIKPASLGLICIKQCRAYSCFLLSDFCYTHQNRNNWYFLISAFLLNMETGSPPP